MDDDAEVGDGDGDDDVCSASMLMFMLMLVASSVESMNLKRRLPDLERDAG